jgi:hypothetical protein
MTEGELRNERYRKLTFDRVEMELLRSIRLRENCIKGWKQSLAESELELKAYQEQLNELRTEYNEHEASGCKVIEAGF